MPELDEELKNEQTDGLHEMDIEGVVNDDELLSDSQIERIADMNLDDIIQDVTSDNFSVEELLNIDKTEEVKYDALSEEDTQKTVKEAANEEQQTVSSDIGNAVKADTKKSNKVKKSKDKKGFFGALRDIFFESIEEPQESDGNENISGDDIPEHPKDENERVLKEMYGVNGEAQNSEAEQQPKKGFFAKFSYRFQQYRKKAAEEERAEEEAEAAEYEEKQQKKKEKKQAALEKKEQKKQEKAAKPSKEKKPKKEKPKKEKAPKEPPKPGDILRIKPKSILLFVLLIAGIVVLTEILISGFHYGFSLTKANKYLENDKYEKAYNQLAGMDLRESDEDIYRQISVIMYVQRQYDSYHTYMEMNKKTEALDALIKGMERYDTYVDEAKFLGVGDDVEAVKKQILSALQSSFSITESEAKTLVELSQKDFTKYYLKIEAYGAA